MPAAMMMPYQCISSGPRSSAIGLSGEALNIIAVTSIGHDLCIQPVVEFLCCIIPHILHAVVHRSHFDDTGKTPSRTDRNRLLVYFRIQYFDLFLIEAETFIRLVRLPRLQVYVQHDPFFLEYAPGTEQSHHIDDAQAPYFEQVPDQR